MHKQHFIPGDSVSGSVILYTRSCRFCSQSGHRARMQVSSLVSALAGGDRSVFLSHMNSLLSPSLCPVFSLCEINEKNTQNTPQKP